MLCAFGAGANDPASESRVIYEEKAPGNDRGWSAGTASRIAPADVDDAALSTVTVRVYRGEDGLPRYGRPKDLAGNFIALDTQVEFEDCADGRVIATGLRIGDWRYALDANCEPTTAYNHAVPQRRPGDVAVEVKREGQLLCDPATWRCMPVSSPPDSPDENE